MIRYKIYVPAVIHMLYIPFQNGFMICFDIIKGNTF